MKEKINEKLARVIAWKLPKKVVYWAYIRLQAQASKDLSNRSINDITCNEALTNWITKYNWIKK